MTKATSFTSWNMASTIKVKPRPMARLVSLPVWISTVLINDRAAIHQNQLAPLMTSGSLWAMAARLRADVGAGAEAGAMASGLVKGFSAMRSGCAPFPCRPGGRLASRECVISQT
jgi:hypothetical protein